jgi:hypothetical protein
MKEIGWLQLLSKGDKKKGVEVQGEGNGPMTDATTVSYQKAQPAMELALKAGKSLFAKKNESAPRLTPKGDEDFLSLKKYYTLVAAHLPKVEEVAYLNALTF